ncbi:MAG: RIP metalloprotease RseP, partial [Bacteroidota bacterium]
MSPFIIKTLQLLLSLSILIVLHELGHFIPARLFKTRVEKFFLFFDIKFALLKKKIGETVYGIGWLPLGGYVKISGMIDESMDKEQLKQPPQPWEFRSKPAWQRLIIMIGGVTVNLIVGFLIYMMILFVWGQEELKPEHIPDGLAVAEELRQFGFRDGDNILKVNGKELDNALDINRYLLVRDIKTIAVKHSDGTSEVLNIPDSIGSYVFKKGVLAPFTPRRTTVIDTVLQGYPAAEAGMRKGDKIVQLNDTKINFFDEIAQELKRNDKGVPSKAVIERNGTTDTLVLRPNEEGKLGINSFAYHNITPVKREYALGSAIVKGFSFGYWTLHDYVVQFKYVFTKKGARQIGGFGAIGNLFPAVWNWQSFWYTTA